MRVGIESEVVRAPVGGFLEGDEEVVDEDPDRAAEGVRSSPRGWGDRMLTARSRAVRTARNTAVPVSW